MRACGSMESGPLRGGTAKKNEELGVRSDELKVEN